MNIYNNIMYDFSDADCFTHQVLNNDISTCKTSLDAEVSAFIGSNTDAYQCQWVCQHIFSTGTGRNISTYLCSSGILFQIISHGNLPKFYFIWKKFVLYYWIFLFLCNTNLILALKCGFYGDIMCPAQIGRQQ